MKQRNVFRMSIFGKLFLVVALFVGGGNAAWAEDIVIYNGSSISEGWTKNTYITLGEEELSLNSNTMIGYLQSPASLLFTNKRLVIEAKRSQDSDVFIGISNSSNYYNYTFLFNYNNSSNKNKYEIFDSNNYIKLVSDEFSMDKQWRIVLKNVIVRSIKLCDGEDLLLDEANGTALSSGLKSETVKVKYSPVIGWNTICMPFQLKYETSTGTGNYDHLNTIFGNGYSIYDLADYDGNGTLSFTQISRGTAYSLSISANKPYLVYAPNADTDVETFDFTSNVTIAYSGNESRCASAGAATFQGTYVTKSYQEGDDWYGVTSDGKVMQAGEGAYVKGYRAYFTGISAPANDARPTIVLVDDGGLTDVGFVKMIDQEAKDVYTLSGQKVEKAGRGIYVVNGRKVVIK